MSDDLETSFVRHFPKLITIGTGLMWFDMDRERQIGKQGLMTSHSEFLIFCNGNALS
jgi:hypothetical protein